MELWQKISEAFPDLDPTLMWEELGIYLQDDNDGFGAYIAKWEYSKPIPEGLTLGKPAA